MTLTTTDAEAATSPSHFFINLQADPSAGSYTQPSFESKKAHQPDVIIDVEEAPTLTQSEPPVATKAYSLNIRKLNIKFAVICLALFLQGWNTGATGPLILAIQKHYDVNYTLVSMVFMVHSAGVISGSVLNVYLANVEFGFGRLVVLGHVAQLVSWIIQAPTPPFPLFVIAYFLGGFDFAIQDAQMNGFVGALEHYKETRVGIMHAFSGLGAFAVGLVSTKFAESSNWSLHYLTSIGVGTACIVCSSLAFRFKRQDEVLEEIGQPPKEREENEQNHYRQIMSQRAVHMMALFVAIYIGSEVTLSGWIVTYIVEIRGGGPSSGYISSGFFGGLTVGRVVLLWFNRLVGERRAVFIYGILTIALEIVIWKVPSLIGNAVTVSFVGILLGPIFPIVVNHVSKVLPHWLFTGSIGWIAGFGQTGVVVLPLVTGALAEKVSIWTLHPLVIGMISLMLFVWFLVPGAPKEDK